jgi:hypothetical protein
MNNIDLDTEAGATLAGDYIKVGSKNRSPYYAMSPAIKWNGKIWYGYDGVPILRDISELRTIDFSDGGYTHGSEPLYHSGKCIRAVFKYNISTNLSGTLALKSVDGDGTVSVIGTHTTASSACQERYMTRVSISGVPGEDDVYVLVSHHFNDDREYTFPPGRVYVQADAYKVDVTDGTFTTLASIFKVSGTYNPTLHSSWSVCPKPDNDGCWICFAASNTPYVYELDDVGGSTEVSTTHFMVAPPGVAFTQNGYLEILATSTSGTSTRVIPYVYLGTDDTSYFYLGIDRSLFYVKILKVIIATGVSSALYTDSNYGVTATQTNVSSCKYILSVSPPGTKNEAYVVTQSKTFGFNLGKIIVV